MEAGKCVLSVREAATYLDVAPKSIRAWIKQGKLGCLRTGRHMRIHDSQMKRFLQENGLEPEKQHAEAA